MKCVKCGTEFEEGVFCPECGNRIVETVNQAQQEKMEQQVDFQDIQNGTYQNNMSVRGREIVETVNQAQQEKMEQRVDFQEIQNGRFQNNGNVRERAAVVVHKNNEGLAMSIAALIMGILSIVTLGSLIFTEILGIVFACFGKNSGKMRGMAKAGMICSIISIVLLVGMIILILGI